MRTLFRTIVLFLLAMFIFSSCATYKESVTLQEAFNSNRRVKITTIDNEQIEYQKIDNIKGKWVGEKLISNNKSEYEPINPKEISKVELHRSKKAEATEGKVALVLIFLPVLFLIGIATAF